MKLICLYVNTTFMLKNAIFLFFLYLCHSLMYLKNKINFLTAVRSFRSNEEKDSSTVKRKIELINPLTQLQSGTRQEIEHCGEIIKHQWPRTFLNGGLLHQQWCTPRPRGKSARSPESSGHCLIKFHLFHSAAYRLQFTLPFVTPRPDKGGISSILRLRDSHSLRVFVEMLLCHVPITFGQRSRPFQTCALLLFRMVKPKASGI